MRLPIWAGWLLILLTPALMAAPVPRDPIPDPLGRGYLGIYFGDEDLSVGRVEPGTAAAKAGLLPGDVFLRVGPLQPRERLDMQRLLFALRPGSRVRVTVQRGDLQKTLVIQLGSRPPELEYVPPAPVP